MSTLSDRTIGMYCTGIVPLGGHHDWKRVSLRDGVRGMPALIEPYREEQLQPASYDLILDHIMDFEGLVYYHHILAPKEFILGSTKEKVNIPDFLVARIEGKSSLARKGLMVHTAGFIDPGFEGNLTLEITNHSGVPFQLDVGMKIAQLAFQTLDYPAQRPYGHPNLGSHYQGQVGATPSRA